MDKKLIDIQRVLTELERPSSNDRIEYLNNAIGRYLDNVTEPLNMSFWETVKFTYWNFVNLAKLCDKKYDVQEDEFIKRIRNIERERLRKSPHVMERPRAVSPPDVSENNTDPIIPKERVDPEDNINTPPTVGQKRWFTSTPVKAVTAVLSGCVIFCVYKYFSNDSY
jgi:hypothetical protein